MIRSRTATWLLFCALFTSRATAQDSSLPGQPEGPGLLGGRTVLLQSFPLCVRKRIRTARNFQTARAFGGGCEQRGGTVRQAGGAGERARAAVEARRGKARGAGESQVNQ